jgi:excisionase family DNA binding protein
LEEKVFLNISEAAAYLGLPESTFRKLVARRYRRIPFTKMGKRIIFKRDILDKWAEKLIQSEIDF